MPIAALYGTRKSTILSTTIKIAFSSIHSSSKTVWRDCHSWMRKKQSNSRRKWTTGRRMRASRQKQHHSKDPHYSQSQQVVVSPTESLTIGLEALEVCSMVKDPRQLLTFPPNNLSQLSRLASHYRCRMLKSVPTEIEHHRWMLWTLHGEAYWASSWRWASLKTR